MAKANGDDRASKEGGALAHAAPQQFVGPEVSDPNKPGYGLPESQSRRPDNSGPLPFSRDTDIAANREARMTGRQIAILWFAGSTYAILGIPLVVGPAVVIWLIPTPSEPVQNFFFIVILIDALFCGAYLSFKAFSFLGDAITRNVSYTTGRVESFVGTRAYFMVVGPVRRAVRKKTFDALPIGAFCHAYYASGSMVLLSLEPTTAEQPHPCRRFGADPIHAWNRLRSSWLVPLVAAFGLTAGVHEVIAAQYWGMIASGASIAVLSGGVLAWLGRRRARN